MKTVIIEDEKLNALRIVELLERVAPDCEVLATLDSVRTAVKWLDGNPAPDLIFMDIQLGDGLSFDIFDQTELTSPVIFTTAYQEYAIKAFKVHSVDYLLKPVSEVSLGQAIEKYRRHFGEDSKSASVLDPKLVSSIRTMLGQNYKSRFMVRAGEHIRSVDAGDIQYFYSLNKGTFLCNTENRSYDINQSLDALTGMLDPELYFRINRKYIISFSAIEDLVHLGPTHLRVVLKGCDDDEVFVSRERLTEFKRWLDR